jgi:hydroxymethylbilane synthase
MGIKGLWTAELEGALEAGVIDLAVHSMKDMPTVLSSRFAIGAVPVRQDPRDVFVSRDGSPFVQLPPGAVVGTSSIRRAVQLRRLRPDIRVETVRGNVDTRLRKLHDPSGPFHGIVLAAAGLARLGLSAQVTHPFEEEELLPAPGQGALAVQCRAEDLRVRELLASIHDRAAGVETTVERAFIDALGASCNTPVGAKATCRGDRVSFVGRWYAVDGSRCIEVRGEAGWDGAEELGRAMAAEAIAEGASPFCAPP